MRLLYLFFDRCYFLSICFREGKSGESPPLCNYDRHETRIEPLTLIGLKAQGLDGLKSGNFAENIREGNLKIIHFIHRYIRYIILMTFLFTVLIYPTPSRSNEVAEKLDPIKVSATRSTNSTDRSTSAITIINREQISKSQHLQVEDILRQVPSLTIVQSGPMGSIANIFMRGTGSGATLVMIDGIQINSNTAGGFDFRDLNLDNTERIEILRGPQSNLWGADAVGGVINIITRRGKGKPSHFISFEGGSFGLFKETTRSSGDLGSSDYSITASRTDFDGFSAANDNAGNTEEDGYEATNISTRLGYEFLDDGRIEFIGRFTKSISDSDGYSFTTSKPIDGPDYNRIQTYYAAIPIQKSLNTWWNTKFNLNLSYDDFKSIDSTLQTSNILNRTYTADLQNNLNFNKYLSAVAGMEYQILNGTNVEKGFHKNIYQTGYFLQVSANYQDKALLTAGFRHDVNSRYENKTTYKIEGSYRLTQTETTLRASTSTGFRGPTLNDLFFPGFSNPDLKPEESENWEVGITQILFDGKMELGMTYFNSDFEDLIQFEGVTFTPQNILKAESQGIETFFSFEFSKTLNISLNHTWTQAVDEDGSPLLRRPKHLFNVNLEHILGDWRSNIGVYHRSGIRDSNFNTEGFTTFRAVVSYQILKNLKLTARAENIFDEDYEEIPGYGTAGVSGFAGFTYNF